MKGKKYPGIFVLRQGAMKILCVANKPNKPLPEDKRKRFLWFCSWFQHDTPEQDR